MLRAIAAGAHLTTVAFSEQGSRSQFWAPLSRLDRQGLGYQTHAVKSWVTAAHYADSYVASAQAPDAQSPLESTLYWMPRMHADVQPMGHFNGLGLRGNDSAPVTFEGVAVIHDHLLVIEWIKKAASEAQFITSHCQGAFLLAKAGLLDNKDATTFPTNTDDLQKRYPACRVQGDRRVVVDGNLITSPGGLASYEASLYVVEQLFGRDQAMTIASALVFGPSNLDAAITSQ